MDWDNFLDFMALAEKLKCATRHCTNSRGDPESVAEHSWRAALMAMTMGPVFPGVDIDRVIRMLLIHDLGEAVTGDIPTFLKNQADEETEEQAVEGILSTLPPGVKEEFSVLFAEMNALETPEARLYKIIDKFEAVIQHNESPISTWEELEYDLQRNYAWKEAEWFPQALALRQEILRRTDRKIEQEKTALGV